jgi:hypothetical protein
VPVYGCGFLHENSAWVPILQKMQPDLRDRWVRYFDPSQYLPRVRCPILMVNGTNDFAYPLDSHRKSYRAVPGDKQLCVTVRMPHSHPAGWAPQEIGLFVDSILRDGTPLPNLARLHCDAQHARVTYESQIPVVEAQLHYTTDQGPWKERPWQTKSAELSDGTVTASLPAARPALCFVTIRDDRGAVVSTEYVQLSESSDPDARDLDR